MQLNIMTSDGKKPVEVIAEFDYMDYEFFVHEDFKRNLTFVGEKSSGHRVAQLDFTTNDNDLVLLRAKKKFEEGMMIATFDKFEKHVKAAIDKWGKAN